MIDTRFYPESVVRRLTCPRCGVIRDVKLRDNLEPDKCVLHKNLVKDASCRSCDGCGWNKDEAERRMRLIREGHFELRDGLKTLILKEEDKHHE